MAQRFSVSNFRSALAGVVLAACLAGFVSGCASGSQASKGAAEGAGTGALAGAVGGMVGALVFGGDVVEAGARGAVYGGTVGAVAGGVSGSKRDKAVAQQQAEQNEQELQKLRNEIGDDAYNGVVALADCKYEVATANAQVAQQSKNRDYALAGLWVEVLIDADQRRESAARERFPELIKQDRKLKNEADAEAAMRDGIQSLGDSREKYGLSRVCT